MALFDNIQKTTIQTVQKLFGDVAFWTPSTGGNELKSLVLYNENNEPKSIGENKFEYRPYMYSFEYYSNSFINLKRNVDNGEVETVKIKNKVLNVREVISKFDGKTFVAFCELQEDTTVIPAYGDDYNEKEYAR